jgi:hypothetical protein
VVRASSGSFALERRAQDDSKNRRRRRFEGGTGGLRGVYGGAAGRTQVSEARDVAPGEVA